MENTVKKYKCTREKDAISELPDDLLLRILYFGTVRDAVNTSVLSRRWRHVAASMTRVTFQLEKVFAIPVDDNTWKRSDSDANRCEQYKDRFVRAVDQFLQYYKGPKMASFSINFCLKKDSTSDIDRWIIFAVRRMGVNRMRLRLTCCEHESAGKSHHRADLYVLRSQLLSGFNIRSLRLRSCVLKLDKDYQLSFLVELIMTKVTMDHHELGYLLSSCLKLHYLNFRQCRLPDELNIPSSLLSLKILIIFRCRGVKHIKFEATNLTKFIYSGSLIRFSFPRPFCKIKELFLNVLRTPDNVYTCAQLARHLPKLQNLAVFAPNYWGGTLTESQIEFSKLKHLKLYISESMRFDFLKIIAILKTCSQLNKFELVAACPKEDYEGEMLEEASGFVYRNLEFVFIGGFCNTWNHIEFAKYLLKYALVLKHMFISAELVFHDLRDGYVFAGELHKRDSWDAGERDKVREKLQGLSSNAVVTIR